jgi:hypothetical protein
MRGDSLAAAIRHAGVTPLCFQRRKINVEIEAMATPSGLRSAGCASADDRRWKMKRQSERR